MDGASAIDSLLVIGGWDHVPGYRVDTDLSDAELDLLCDLALSDVDKSAVVRDLRIPTGV